MDIGSDQDLMRDVYMTQAQREAYARIANDAVRYHRMRGKLAKRDKRIAGMQRRIASLERALSTRTLDLEKLSGNVEHAVTRALCNVRMIPVFHGLSTDRIVEVNMTATPR